MRDRDLIEAAARGLSVAADLQQAWGLFMTAVGAGWVNTSQVLELIQHMRSGEFGGWGSEELLIEPSWTEDDVLQVRLLGDRCVCPSLPFLRHLEGLEDRLALPKRR